MPNNGSPKKKTPMKKATPKKAVAAKKSAPKKKQAELAIRNVPIRRHVPSGQRAVYANHVVVRGEPGIFHLLFFEIQAPIILHSDHDDIKKEASQVAHIDAECVSRIAIPSSLLSSVIEALQSNLKKMQATIGVTDEDTKRAIDEAIKEAKRKK